MCWGGQKISSSVGTWAKVHLERGASSPVAILQDSHWSVVAIEPRTTYFRLVSPGLSSSLCPHSSLLFPTPTGVWISLSSPGSVRSQHYWHLFREAFPGHVLCPPPLPICCHSAPFSSCIAFLKIYNNFPSSQHISPKTVGLCSKTSVTSGPQPGT